jgi:hypothetical protein
LQAAELLEQRRQTRRKGRLRVGAKDQARDGDADLRDGDIPVQFGGAIHNGKQPLGQLVAFAGERLQPAAANADGRKLSSNVKGRAENQHRGNDRRYDHHEVLNTVDNDHMGIGPEWSVF